MGSLGDSVELTADIEGGCAGTAAEVGGVGEGDLGVTGAGGAAGGDPAGEVAYFPGSGGGDLELGG